ncbi:MAG: hypothetical protein JWO36_1920 [Myxococcales bacterium]|nr:hypothetical protein [Myxococcales bacterium]
MSQVDLDQGLKAYTDHLTRTAKVFNDHAKTLGLAVSMDPKRAIKAAMDGIGLGRISSFWTRQDDTGIIHETQLMTAIECVVKLHEDAKRCGHVVGAMQSGKTTTSLALQWAGPILYRLTGRRAYPFYVIGNQRNHEDQTTTELDRFMTYYGHIEICVKKPVAGEDPLFARSPSLLTYREQVLRSAESVHEVPRLEDIVHRRVGGEQSVGRIVKLCQDATAQGYRPLMIIDEPQFGASDRLVPSDDGTAVRKCVLAQIFDRIEEALKPATQEHWFVGLSATPFELNDLKRVWEVRQRLTDNYSGFNYFNEEPISPGVEITPPTTMSLTEFAKQINVPFLSSVSLSAYDKPEALERHAPTVGFEGTHDEYREQMEDALRDAIYAVVKQHKNDDKPVGLCIRAFNDNSKMQTLMQQLKLDPKRIEVLAYYGLDTSGVSVKRAIARREHPELPYLVIVTNRARMADAFPTQVRFFMDLAKQSSDLNALLQGLLGRACGYNKQSTVVLSDSNAEIVKAYIATKGGYVHKTSRHSIAVNGGYRRGAPTSMLKLRIEMTDPLVAEFFKRVNADIVEPHIPRGPKMKTPRTQNGEARRGPLLTIAEKLKLFDHLEQQVVRSKLFPELVTGFKVARRNDTVRSVREPGTTLTYSLNPKGECRYTFRRAERTAAAKGGAAGRAKGQKDAAGGPWIEPTVYVEKYSPETGKIIADDTTVGDWRAFMVTFPLREPVREVVVATVAYPIEASPFSEYMELDEIALRATAKQRKPAHAPTP